MREYPLASIVIDNYNYGRFLGKAIDSALAQTYPCTEVIVVDDGSTDDSREIIMSHRNRIKPVLKENGGQASAFNAGFAESHGDIVLFLDADDLLLPNAVDRAAASFNDPEIIKCHWPLWKIDENGHPSGALIPGAVLPDGDLREEVRRSGPGTHAWPPTTGNAWKRSFLEKIMPVPESEFRIGADSYLFELAPFFGPVKALAEPLGRYRVHGQNNWSRMPFAEKLRHELTFYDRCAAVIQEYCAVLGIAIDPAVWKANSWWHRLERAVEEISALIPAGEPFILVDQDDWGLDATSNRCPIPFLERDGMFWGPPADDTAAIRELDRLQGRGARFLVLGWPAFWFLEHYAEFTQHLRTRFPCVLDNERVVVFHLQEQHSPGPSRCVTQNGSALLSATPLCPEGDAS